ncbi:matrixin family metalloprotease [Ornithinimicrobium pratense]|uniref:Matrixin family metalloprotease n=1 Tax=Ornithinimicrobium pratense TaxID=2593973 RepID=A0A5J6V9P6_9MICO|nr:matrixin family metalloprotease [Ornithinimicrobium pratense]QFG69921.1 matrixin family metalloprotease [Ornithinimicrobium pratense]
MLATMVVLALVITSVIAISPVVDFGDVRRTVLTHDRLDGVPGSGGEGYSYLATSQSGAPVTWACEAIIEVEVNPQGAPEGYAELVASALATVNEASSFTFEVVAETDDRQFFDRPPGPVLLGWASEEEVPDLVGPVAGLGGPSYVSGPGGARSVTGTVVIDTDLPRGWFRGMDEEAVLVHELLHVLGLGHTQESGQLMAARHHGQSELGEGDLAGLAALEAHACGTS